MEFKPGENPFEEPENALRRADPATVAELSGAEWRPGEGGGTLVLPVLDGFMEVDYPDISIEAPPRLSTFVLKLLSVIYLGKADGTALEGRWVAYRELPGGRFYEPVVKRSVEDPLADRFGGDLPTFDEAALSIGGTREQMGDSAYSFSLFPRVSVCFCLWRADEEFPAGAQVLFDASCHHHLNPFEMRMGSQEISTMILRASRGHADA